MCVSVWLTLVPLVRFVLWAKEKEKAVVRKENPCGCVGSTGAHRLYWGEKMSGPWSQLRVVKPQDTS